MKRCIVPPKSADGTALAQEGTKPGSVTGTWFPPKSGPNKSHQKTALQGPHLSTTSSGEKKKHDRPVLSLVPGLAARINNTYNIFNIYNTYTYNKSAGTKKKESGLFFADSRSRWLEQYLQQVRNRNTRPECRHFSWGPLYAPLAKDGVG